MSEDLSARFASLVKARPGEVPLDEAVLLVAAHADPGLDLGEQQARLDAMAAGVASPSVDALRSRLVDDLGFGGDLENYHDPRNSLLPSVLDRRRGIPLTLAIVAIEVGRRCDVPLVGVGMPGHFLLRGADEAERFVDLFAGGAELDRSGCRAIFERLHVGAPWDDRYLEPVDNRLIVTRLLANLANAYRRSGDARSLAWTIDLRLHLPGASERDRRELALVLGAAGRYGEAATHLEATGAPQDEEAAARLRARLN